ncbi:MAG: AN1-type zinc finger domain-containing protein [Candidatus Bathyarchaeia archaeon]
MKCQKCETETSLPFRCPYCGGYFCTEHRLPENHECPKMKSARAPVREEQTQFPQSWKPIEYTITYFPIKPGSKIHFSVKEVTHLAAAALLVLGIGLSLGMTPTIIQNIGGIPMLFAFGVLVTVSFLIHELAHKFTAQKSGAWAEFRIMLFGLILTAISIVSPLFKIISPGAVVIAGLTSKSKLGKISIAGPLTNILLSIGFFLAAHFVSPNSISYLFLLASWINAWISFINLIPYGMLDGYKIFLWDKFVWALAFITSLVLMITSLILFTSL